MTRSVLFFLLLAAIHSPLCFAQKSNNIAEPKEIKKIEANYKTTLANLKQIGYPDVGYYPLCSDVISLEEKKIGEVFRKNCELGGKPNPNYCYDRNWDSLIASQKVYGRINSNAVVKPFYEPQKKSHNSYNEACFSKDAAVNMLFVRSSTKLENYSTQKIDVDWHRTAFNKVSYDDQYAKNRNLVGASIKFQTLQKVAKKIVQDDYTPYVLGSTIPLTNDPDYQVDCWSLVKQRIETEVENGTILKLISFGNGSVGISATPEHRFYACFEDSVTKDTKCDWVAAQKLNPKTMKLFGGNHQLVPFAEITDIPLEEKYSEGDINSPGIFYPAKVYNLSTETFSYYVTDSINRVLVHNVY